MSTNFAAALGSVSNSLAVAVGILLPIAWISLLLRLWVRKRMLKSLGWDDWTILAACVCNPSVKQDHTHMEQMIFTAHCGIVLELYHKEKTENFGSLPALQNFFSVRLQVQQRELQLTMIVLSRRTRHLQCRKRRPQDISDHILPPHHRPKVAAIPFAHHLHAIHLVSNRLLLHHHLCLWQSQELLHKLTRKNLLHQGLNTPCSRICAGGREFIN